VLAHINYHQQSEDSLTASVKYSYRGMRFNTATSVATGLLVFDGTGGWRDRDGLDVIAWSVSIATGTILDLLL